MDLTAMLIRMVRVATHISAFLSGVYIMLRLIYFIPIWIMFAALETILILIGLIVIPIAALFKAYYLEAVTDYAPWGIYHFKWKWMWIFDNIEDGIANDNYKHFGSQAMFKRIVYWSAIRNPVNNLRYVPYISCKADPEKVRFYGSFLNCPDAWWNKTMRADKDTYFERINKYDTKVIQWFLCWQGIYAGFYWQFIYKKQLRRFWIGWKNYPTNIYYTPEYQKRGVGFAIQFKKVF